MTIHSSSVLNADFGSKIPMSVWKTGVVRLPSQTMHHLEKKPSKLPCICIKFDSHPKTTGNLFMIETNSTSPMGFSWNFHWKHFTCLFRMKSYQWQKVTTSFKIVAETLKLVPFQKNNHFQGLKFQKKNLPSPKNSAATTNNSSKVPVYWNVSPPAVFVESYKDHSEPPNVDPRFPPRNGKNCFIWKFSQLPRDAYMKLSNKSIFSWNEKTQF